MKTSTFISTITFAFLMLISANTNAQDFPGLDKSPMDAASYPTSYKDSNKLIKIIYSRPQLDTRSVKSLAPVGEIWRTGANEAAELTLYAPMVFGDAKIAAGTYTFYLLPGEKNWTVIISKDLNVWGSYFYNQENDVARMEVGPYELDDHVDAFSIAFKESKEGGIIMMNIGWGKTRLMVPFDPNL